MKKTFIYASKSHVPDYFIDSNNNRFKIVTDQLGSVRLVINTATGEVKEKMNHDEFGKVLIDTNPNYIPFGFAGGIYDTETKLVRFGVRDYDSEIGRWTSKDPILFEAGDSNIYGYVLDEPINKIDPKGTYASLPVTGGPGTGYVDIGGSIGFGLIFSGGFQIGGGVTCVYVGMGVGTPGGAVNVTPTSSPSPGPSGCLAGGGGLGGSVSAGNNGISYGGGFTAPGISLTVNGNFICW